MRQSCNDYLLTDLPEADEMEGNAHASPHAHDTHGTLCIFPSGLMNGQSFRTRCAVSEVGDRRAHLHKSVDGGL